MDSTSLTQLVSEHLAKAQSSSAGRSAHTVYGGQQHSLRQTLIALAAGEGLDDHESPGEATLQVLQGRVRLGTASDEWEGGAGDYLVLPPERHDLKASEPSAVLLTVAIRR
jgi:quercetin dioxygenase-like cupin family protein